MPEPSKNRLNRIGEKLRDGIPLDPAEAADFDWFRESRGEALSDALAPLLVVLSRANVVGSLTSRVKTRDTLIQKLQRETTKLAQVQDVAGARYVVEGGHLAQDLVVAELKRGFDVIRDYDRRESPMFGYRAVHVVIRFRDCLIEVQVRTRLQHAWAEANERIADLWGRDLRYGASLRDERRSGIHVQMLQLSDTCHEHEAQMARLELLNFKMVSFGVLLPHLVRGKLKATINRRWQRKSASELAKLQREGSEVEQLMAESISTIRALVEREVQLG
jgi:ppGpp synthetase/RelA/SpoT-type nucleotidyltranferase